MQLKSGVVYVLQNDPVDKDFGEKKNNLKSLLFFFA